MAEDDHENQSGSDGGRGYMMGHTASEAQRLDKQHIFFRHVVDGNLLSPMLNESIRSGKIRRILDIGTGTGIWCSDAAAELQAISTAVPVEFLGVDVAENEHWPLYQVSSSQAQGTQQTHATISFQVVDLNDDVGMGKLVEKYGQFDLINSRMLISAVKRGKWEAYIDRIFRLLRPGGYVQLFEADMMDSNLGRSNDQTVSEALVITHAVYNGLGLDPACAQRLAGWLYQAGFVRVRDTAYWCNPVVRGSDGNLKADDIIYDWHATAYGVLQPFYLKLRQSPEYEQLLQSLPPQAYHNVAGGKVNGLLADEAEYGDFLRRHDTALRNDPLYRTVFRTVLAQRPD